MSTRSNIAIKKEDGSVVSIYCHWDGYESHHMPILKEHYNTVEKVEALIALGNLSSLDNSIECPENHSIDNDIEGYCVFYDRDKGEDKQEAIVWDSKEAYLQESDSWVEYKYLFEDNEWKVFKV